MEVVINESLSDWPVDVCNLLATYAESFTMFCAFRMWDMLEVYEFTSTSQSKLASIKIPEGYRISLCVHNIDTLWVLIFTEFETPRIMYQIHRRLCKIKKFSVEIAEHGQYAVAGNGDLYFITETDISLFDNGKLIKKSNTLADQTPFFGSWSTMYLINFDNNSVIQADIKDWEWKPAFLSDFPFHKATELKDTFTKIEYTHRTSILFANRTAIKRFPMIPEWVA